jgi:hypothetical protein
MDLKQLLEPMPVQWRVQSYSKHKPNAQCVAYVDARDVMHRLDEVCGPENWQSDFKEVNGQIYGGIGIRTEYGVASLKTETWVWKWDTGSESNVEKEKGQASDAFKRAAVKWGIGRFLYDLPIRFVDTDGPLSDTHKYPHVIDEQGKRVYDLTAHLTKSSQSRQAAPQRTKPTDTRKDPATELLAQKDRVVSLLKQLGFKPVGKTVAEKRAEVAAAVFKHANAELTDTNLEAIAEILSAKVEQLEAVADQ